MTGGLFIALYDEDSLKLYLDKGVYGFLMKPVMEDKPSARSRHYQILADYACSREGTDVFFFLRRMIVYGGKIFGNKTTGSFYLNGSTSPLGRTHHAELFWDESVRDKYTATSIAGVFKIQKYGPDKSQPFIFQFKKNENSGKYITSDELYFELGKYPYPLPSNSMQGMGFCTLTPGEVNTLKSLISQSKERIAFEGKGNVEKNRKEVAFDSEKVSLKEELINEAQLEFIILSSLKPFNDFLTDDYVLCRQVPISPFKPSEMDRADICLYSLTKPIKNGTIPNVIIELKKGTAGKAACLQVERYLKWIKNITTAEEYAQIQAYIIAPKICKKNSTTISTEYRDKIRQFSISKNKFITLE